MTSLPDGVDAVFDHVAIAGPSIADLLPLYADLLGGRDIGGGVNTVLGFRTLQLAYPDGSRVELLDALPGSAFLTSFLARTGGLGGLHHVTFVTSDLRGALVALERAGFAPFGVTLDHPAWSEAFLHPRTTGGVLLQLAQKGPAFRAPYPSWPAMRAAG